MNATIATTTMSDTAMPTQSQTRLLMPVLPQVLAMLAILAIPSILGLKRRQEEVPGKP